MSSRYPTIARVCFHLDWIFLLLWVLYLLGPDVADALGITRNGRTYALLSGGLFVIHFVLISTGIIALFVMIIELHARRPARGFAWVILALVLPTISFLYFATRYLLQVERFLERR